MLPNPSTAQRGAPGGRRDVVTIGAGAKHQLCKLARAHDCSEREFVALAKAAGGVA